LKVSAIRGSEMHQRFLREARAVSLVRHPGVVEVLDVFELEGGLPVMVMALLVGETLGAKLEREKTVPVDQVVALVLRAVEAVEAAHVRGIVHRDLKPDNIFLEAGDAGHVVVRVLDFGIAKLTATEGDASETGALTGTGSVLGTPWYMAPEQLCGERNIDARADVWSLGVILYECLSGRRPIDGSNVAQLVARVLRDEIVPIEERVPGIAPELARLVGRMLAREPDDRPRDLAEVRQVLAHLAGRGTSKPPPSRSFGASRIGAALVAVIAVGILGWSVVHSTSRRRSELDAEALLTTRVAATGASEVAAVPPLLGTAAATAPDVATSPATPLPKPSSVEEHASVGYRHPSAAPSHPTESALSRRAPEIADAGVAAKDPPPAASASSQPASSARHKGGGLFEGVPF
jgi:eukaryotic-like serine/threonine-protein kinase